MFGLSISSASPGSSGDVPKEGSPGVLIDNALFRVLVLVQESLPQVILRQVVQDHILRNTRFRIVSLLGKTRMYSFCVIVF